MKTHPSTRRLTVTSLLASGFMLLAVSSTILAQTAVTGASQSHIPLMDVLDKFTAADVPVLGPDEIKTPTRSPRSLLMTDLPGKGLAEHPMLYAGEEYNKMFVVDKGKVIWSYSTGEATAANFHEFDDVWMLSNGNILFTQMPYIAEVTPEKQVVWRYDAPPGTEIHGCQPIGLDKVLFIENGLPPQLMVVNTKTNAVEVQHALPCKSLTDPKTVHAQFRRVRYTADGHYLVPYMNLGRIVEYDKDFKEVWSYPKGAWAAIRLKNGNTLITFENQSLTEVNSKGETVWQLKPSDLPPEYQRINFQSCTRLDNGNTIICSRGGNNKGPRGPQLVEVTPDKKVVWALEDWTDLGPATCVQILDDPGIPENPGDSQH